MSGSERIAIVGMGGVFPGAAGWSDVARFWRDVKAGQSVAREVPAGRWPVEKGDVLAKGIAADKVYSARGCFVDDFRFDAEGLKISREELAGLDPMFHLLLHAGRAAWGDAVTKGIAPERAGIIVGNIVLPTESVSAFWEEIVGGMFAEELKIENRKLKKTGAVDARNRYVAGLPGLVLARALGIEGAAFTLDAACASSLYALKLAVEELRSGRADVMLTGGVSRPDCLYTQMGFAQLRALSASGVCAPFDRAADGLVVGEGAGILVLKRLEDALAAGDKIYATIAGIGLSNDVAGNLMQPDSSGQLRAMRAAYREAEWNPADVDLVECHGTGTPVGDAVEFASLRALRGEAKGKACVIGSVKSNVGHLLTAAGAAGLIKVLLAMREKTLPPTANFRTASEKIDVAGSGLEVLREAKEWERPAGHPRRAAVSGFGFGGINAHVLLEEWEGERSQKSEVRSQKKTEKVAIVGIGGRFGPWKSVEEMGRRMVGMDRREAERSRGWWGAKEAKARRGFFVGDVEISVGRYRIPPAELAEMLPQQLLMLEAAADALEDAGLRENPAERLDTGVFIGIGLDLNTTNFRLRWTMREKAKKWMRELSGDAGELGRWTEELKEATGPALSANRTMGALGGIVASRVARAFHVGGPSFTISSEETSGLDAVAVARGMLERGEIDVALTGAVDLAGDLRAAIGEEAVRGVAEIIGEGAGAVVLKRLTDAERDGDRIYAVLGDSEKENEALAIDTAEFGSAGAANGILGVIKAALCLHHQTICEAGVGRYWLRDRKDGPRRAAVAVENIDGRRMSVELEGSENSVGEGMYFADDAMRGEWAAALAVKTDAKLHGKIAFVFPGSGTNFTGMGRELAAAFPKILARQDVENERLSAQFAGKSLWREGKELAEREGIFAQVSLGVFVSDVLRSFGVKPEAVIGYSLGETTGLFASGAWGSSQRDVMYKRMAASPLFVDDLCGRCDVVRRAWKLGEHEEVDWVVGVVDRAAEIVRPALEKWDRVYLLIVNTRTECVIGGDRWRVAEFSRDLGARFHEVRDITTVHCEVARGVEKAYRDLHLLETKRLAGVKFYSGILGRSYAVTRESAADSIVGQAVAPFDYTKVIEAAYADGVRYFIEVGPGATCTRMIDAILEGREHFARSVCAPGQDGAKQLLRVLKELAERGVELDLSVIGRKKERREFTGKTVVVRTGDDAFVIPPMPRQVVERETPREVVPSRSPEWSTAVEGSAHAEAHGLFLSMAERNTQVIGEAIALQMRLLSGGGAAVVEEAEPLPLCRRAVALERGMCLEFAIGSVGRVLGEKFAHVDEYPTRVRLPDEPLMLVDRIVEIEGEANSMSSGRVVTEHDIHEGAWYLDGGRIPTCIAVEAGQADLFLSGYLGIDSITKGRAVYRLLDAVVTFHAPLPGPGKTIVYDIAIEEFFRQGATHLFRFHFEATVDGVPFLSMRKGCAGFFTQEELGAGQGIVLTSLEKRPGQGKFTGGFEPLVEMRRENYSDEQLTGLRAGDLVRCFGEMFRGLQLQNPATLPAGRMTLVHRILDLNPAGGRFGIGQITGEADIHPDDWFLTCHFVDDMVMPGTLMYECCLHTLRVYLLRMGWVGEAEEISYEPVPEVAGQLKCRGQVTSGVKKVQYEVTLKELGYESDGTPYVIADALMYADGKAVVQMTGMSLRMGGMTKRGVEALWNRELRIENREKKRGAIFDGTSICAFSGEKPSEAFGDRYAIFDPGAAGGRKIARLPRAPYQFLDRIVSIKDCEQWVMKAGGEIEAEYDVPSPPMDAWYFAANEQASGGREMPFAVLLEVALQPCGWLAAYVGSALSSATDLKFRNLGGSATQFMAVGPEAGTLTTAVKMTNVSTSGGMVIQHYEMTTRCAAGVVYKGTTYFGFFSKEALANQVGIRDAALYVPTAEEHERAVKFAYPQGWPFPERQMRMVDEITHFDSHGGPKGLGFICGRTAVDAEAWFFQAHFFEDPVWPGSLGLESFVQLLKVFAWKRWGGAEKSGVRSRKSGAVFETLAVGAKHEWIYRGQILPSDKAVTIEAVVTAVDDGERMVRADGFLSVDGRVIYQMKDFAIRMRVE